MKTPDRKPRTRKAILDYLGNHFRYNTMNSWNNGTSFAHNVKVHHLDLTTEQSQACYELLDADHAFTISGFNAILSAFDRRHNYRWQIGSNGRSGGYLVLYQGEAKPSGYKSHCLSCGQMNYKSIAETDGSRRCGRCGEDDREDFEPGEAPLQIGTFPGRSVTFDPDESTDSLHSLVDVVWDFDQTCWAAVQAFVKFATGHQVVEKQIMVPKTIKVAVSRDESEE